jgi:hypothetical protein
MVTEVLSELQAADDIKGDHRRDRGELPQRTLRTPSEFAAVFTDLVDSVSRGPFRVNLRAGSPLNNAL